MCSQWLKLKCRVVGPAIQIYKNSGGFGGPMSNL